MSHKVLFPERQFVDVAGRKVEVKPVRFRDFERFGRAAGNAIAMAASQTTEQLYVYATKSGVLLDVLGPATSLSKWRIRRLPAVVVVQLMFEVIRVNKGFFEQALVSAASVLAGAESSSD
ncbi:hypothetical protein SAMN05216421_1111 [Halopseudomonas xinjiangensis]|uniref:Uncharacterized protein n=1 Tax=Halopseudomonas xinjiangensis TaxID=487184 RepID=A0A1H1QDA4_9GAMM|nr:hypothetical protein [Halopseudomonas xinjiangensis]SDS21405.1 hypothetical protein SAMN05216421_1111 [Halopseudomonas xinjiangensis]